MPGQVQSLPLRVYRTDHRIMVVAPMPGLEPTDISITVTGERVTIQGRERGPHQHDRDLVLAQWAIGPYEGHVALPEPVEGALTNATMETVCSFSRCRRLRPASTALRQRSGSPRSPPREASASATSAAR